MLLWSTSNTGNGLLASAIVLPDPSPPLGSSESSRNAFGADTTASSSSSISTGFPPARDLTSLLTVPPTFPLAFGGFSALYRGVLRGYVDESQGPLGGYSDNIMEVAVKVLRVTDTVDKERALKRLSREALVLSAVDHPLIAKFYGTAVVYGHLALVLKWYHKGDASHYSKDKSMSEKLSIIEDIAQGLEHLHANNIVHGDVKGSNVLISDSGRGVLTDFGLSRIIETCTGTTTSSMSGSTHWLSPELVARLLDSKILIRTTASDVWAFGCTAYELLSGTLPYSERKSSFAVAQDIRQGALPLSSVQWKEIPPSIRPVLELCWQPTPSQRPTMADVVRMLS